MLKDAYRMIHLSLVRFFFSGDCGGARAATIACDMSVTKSSSISSDITYPVKDVLELELRQGRALDVLALPHLGTILVRPEYPLCVLFSETRHFWLVCE